MVDEAYLRIQGSPKDNSDADVDSSFLVEVSSADHKGNTHGSEKVVDSKVGHLESAKGSWF
jgi:hypothetical protein